jgi:AraC-like DNA-binding protein
MAVVLEAVAHPPEDRAELVQEVIARSGARRRVELKAPADAVDVRAEAWEVGATRVLRTVGTGLTLTRTDHDVRRDAPELVAIALARGGCTYSACGTEQRLGPNGVVVVDFTSPYAYSHAGPRMNSFVTHIAHADLGVGVDVVRAAIPRLASSELMPLVRAHLLAMSAAIDEAAASPVVAADLGAATTDLTRALLVSAAGDRRERDVLDETLRARVVAHIRSHLGDRDLTPAQIAAAHHVSLRTLYNVWGDRDGTLADWILRERLDRVRRELPFLPPGATIFAVARRWGFVDPRHFARRFRAVYGVTPSEWVHGPRSAIARV